MCVLIYTYMIGWNSGNICRTQNKNTYNLYSNLDVNKILFRGIKCCIMLLSFGLPWSVYARINRCDAICDSCTIFSSPFGNKGFMLQILNNPSDRALNFRHRASCILGQAFHYSPEIAFYIFNQQIYFII